MAKHIKIYTVLSRWRFEIRYDISMQALPAAIYTAAIAKHHTKTVCTIGRIVHWIACLFGFISTSSKKIMRIKCFFDQSVPCPFASLIYTSPIPPQKCYEAYKMEMQNRHSWFLWCLIFEYFSDISRVFLHSDSSALKNCSIRVHLLSLFVSVSVFFGIKAERINFEHSRRSDESTTRWALIYTSIYCLRFMMNVFVFITFELRDIRVERRDWKMIPLAWGN